ncbi:glycosyltransferase [Leifsonia sp. YIM 134122]|uniref:Glycosyltransferase n=1 Tax=Leifsonia stereocauli TaxID=3134136 RepID=A0ABU9W6P7_9MICO
MTPVAGDGKGRPSLAIVTCYRHPDYVRAITLRAAAEQSGRFSTVTVVKNSARGLRRYGQVAAQLWRLRRARPDAYLVTFRGYEILPVVLLLAGRRPVYYDEFINPVEWFVHEHHHFGERSLPARLLRQVFRMMMRRTAGVLADTESHAAYSASLMGLSRGLFHAIPVSTDEEHFSPGSTTARSAGVFTVLYYGSMLPLHGVDVVLDAAVRLAADEGIRFHLVGGDEETMEAIRRAVEAGARIDYTEWVDYAELPALFSRSDLMLGGPFGVTVQSRFVITGKTYQFLASALPTVIGENLESHVFSHRGDALIVRRGDGAALAAEIAWASVHRDELTAIGSSGRVLYEERFSNADVASLLGRVILPEDPAQVEQARDAE